MKKKGFTLVELLVVIAIIALLMGILMPALARVRQIAFRMVCGSNLSGIGKAMLIYANDYQDELPKSGIKGDTLTLNTLISNWMAPDRTIAFASHRVTMTSCLYLLIKYAEVTPKSFICKGDGATEFKLLDETNPVPPVGTELIAVWDFGSAPTTHCSYSYHQPLQFGGTTYSYALTTSSDPGMAIAADRSPWTPLLASFATFDPSGNTDAQILGNSNSHQQEGQNVLFLDSHVYFEKRSYCGIEDDNIYTYWAGSSPDWGGLDGKRKGTCPAINSTTMRPQDRKDSLLLNNKQP